MSSSKLNLFEETVLREIAHEPLRVDAYGEFQSLARLRARFSASQQARLSTATTELIRNQLVEEINETHHNGAHWSGYRLTPLGRSLLARSVGMSTSYNFGDVSGSNIAIGDNITQLLKDQDEDANRLLEELKAALESKNKTKVLKTLGYIGDKSVDLLIVLIARGIRQ